MEIVLEASKWTESFPRSYHMIARRVMSASSENVRPDNRRFIVSYPLVGAAISHSVLKYLPSGALLGFLNLLRNPRFCSL